MNLIRSTVPTFKVRWQLKQNSLEKQIEMFKGGKKKERKEKENTRLDEREHVLTDTLFRVYRLQTS